MAEADDLEQRTQKSLETCLEVTEYHRATVFTVLPGRKMISVWEKSLK